MNTAQETDNASNVNENPLKGTQLSFIGCGVMAESIIAGLLRHKLVTPEQITGSHPRAARREERHARYGMHVFESNREAVTQPLQAEGASSEARSNSIIILGIKPQRLPLILNELKGALHLDQLVLSIVAGAKLETISGELLHPAVVRAMPNTHAQFGHGKTEWTSTSEDTQSPQAP
jgi:pyrroline-5-carboxylate reductase